MRLFATILVYLTVFSFSAVPVAAQGQSQQQPSGQTLMKRLMGNKNQTSPFKSKALGETQEQHDHYVRRNPDDQPITSNTVGHKDD